MQTWQKTCAEQSLIGVGNLDLLGLPMTAFFASRQCPGTAIRAAMDWALQLATVLVVAHASLGGGLAGLMAEWRLKRPLTVAELNFWP